MTRMTTAVTTPVTTPVTSTVTSTVSTAVTGDTPPRPQHRLDRAAGQIHTALAIGATAIAVIMLAVLASIAGFAGPDQQAGCATQPGAGRAARTGIPADYLALYRRAGQRYGIGWHILAAIGKVESDHGRLQAAGVRSGENYAGAGGPMQFLRPTWAQYGLDGDRDGRTSRYDPADAISAAAHMLTSTGAPQRLRAALFGYNHSWDYVSDVLATARRYAADAPAGPTSAAATPTCSPASPALTAAASSRIAPVIRFALTQVGKRYRYGGTGPDSWDCSGLTQAAYRTIGVHLPRTAAQQFTFGARIPPGQEQPGDLVFFYNSPDTAGPGKPGHVALIVGANMTVNARCTACRPGVQLIPYRHRRDIAGFTRPLTTPAPHTKK